MPKYSTLVEMLFEESLLYHTYNIYSSTGIQIDHEVTALKVVLDYIDAV